MTWGPQHDIWSAAIAISHLKFGLKGGLAYREIEHAIAADVTSTGNPWDIMDDKTRALLQDPAAVTRGFKHADEITKEQIKVPESKAGYLVNWCEDLGYADFYRLAFKLFGLNAYSTHYLFMTLLMVSLLVFLGRFIGDDLPMATLTLAVTTFFILSASPIFGESLPSLAANRNLSVLGLIPLLHLIHAALSRRPLGSAELGAIAFQALLLAFVASTRGSATWCYVALLVTLISVALFRSRPLTWKSLTIGGLGDAWRSPDKYVRRIALAGAVSFGVIAVFSWINNAQIDDRYRQEDNLPHHLFWHSAFLGLTFHPDWPKEKPYPDLPDSGDSAGFHLFEKVMKERDDTAVAPSGFYRARVYEKFIRDQYFSFLSKHPQYALELFFYYKPRLLRDVLVERMRSVPLGAALIALVAVILVSMLLGLSRTNRVSAYAEVGGGTAVVWLSSLLPSFWAYPAPHVIGDQLLGTWFMLLALASAVGALVVYALSNFRRMDRKSAEKPTAVDAATS
jgi:hypothetical protein